MSTRVVFMGTPDFAVPALTALITAAAAHDWQVAAVVTQPDRPQGRGRKLTPSPVKMVAMQAELPVLQPKTFRVAEAVSELSAFRPDLIVVAAFGQILPKTVLELPGQGCVNIHASLLPRWRGAAPVAAAIRAGDPETGVTLMLMDEGMDTGPMLAQRTIPIAADHTRGSLTNDLAELGADLLIESLPAWLAGRLEPQSQDNRLATLAPRLRKEEGNLDWSRSAEIIERQVRAFHPWPGTFTSGPRGRFKVIAVELATGVAGPGGSEPGTVFEDQQGIYVTTGEGTIRLVTVQPAGKQAMPVEAMVNGQPELLGVQLQRDL